MSSVRIALIDSGVNAAHPHVEGVARGMRIIELPERGIVRREGLEEASDPVGHGTACAGVIRMGLPEVELFAIRILDRRLRAPMACLLDALDFCLEESVDVVNLSLGTRDERYLSELTRRCAALWARGTMVVAAVGGDEHPGWPAALPTVLAVAPDPAVAHGRVGVIDEGPLFLTSPFPRAVPGQPLERNFAGASFAAAHLSAAVGRSFLLEPHAGAAERVEWLRQLAVPEARFPTREAWLQARRTPCR